MAGPLTLTQLTADGEIDAAGAARIVYAVTLTGGSDAAIAELRSGGASGTVLLTLKAPTVQTVHAEFPGGVVFGSGCYVNVTGTGVLVSVAYA